MLETQDATTHTATHHTPTPKAARQGSRLDFLDALRGLAAFYVVIYHLLLLPNPDLALPRWAKLVVSNGGMGVTLFFVVSAFSLYYTMPMRRREPSPWTSFFIHRFFRIAPLFYLWIAMTIVRDKIIYGADHSVVEIAASATFLFNLLPQGQEGFVWASWTIGVEMLFYLLFPLFYVYAKERWQAVAMTIWLLIGWTVVQGLSAYLVADPKSHSMFLQWSFLRHLPVFACGAIAYHLFFENERIVDKPRELGVGLTAIAAGIYVALINGWLPSIFGSPYYWQAVSFTVLLLGLGWAPMRLLVNPITSYLGRISYSLYLNHPTTILLLASVYPWIYRQNLGLSLSFLLCVAVTFTAAIALSELTYRLVEKPGIALGKKFNESLRRRQQAVAG